MVLAIGDRDRSAYFFLRSPFVSHLHSAGDLLQHVITVQPQTSHM